MESREFMMELELNGMAQMKRRKRRNRWERVLNALTGPCSEILDVAPGVEAFFGPDFPCVAVRIDGEAHKILLDGVEELDGKLEEFEREAAKVTAERVAALEKRERRVREVIAKSLKEGNECCLLRNRGEDER